MDIVEGFELWKWLNFQSAILKAFWKLEFVLYWDININKVLGINKKGWIMV